MQKCSRLLFALLSAVLLASCQDKPAALVFSAGVSQSSSIEAFQKTVYPIVQANCASCHASSVSPFFAQPDVTEAHSTMIGSFKVNLDDPASSRIHQRLKVDLHNCWGDCASNAATMLEAINTWAKMTKDSRKITGVKTEVVSISSSIQQYPVLGDTTIFEAEGGAISGRILDLPAQSASGLKALTTQKVATHPKGESTRYGQMNSQCNVADPAAYKVYNKVIRHPNANGYQPYSLTLRYYPIKPSARDAYIQALKDKGSLTPTELQPFIWVGRVSISPLFTYINNAPVILPDGLTIEQYNARLAAGTLPADYFARRFNGNYYVPTAQAIRKLFNNLQTQQQFISKALFAPIGKAFLAPYFNGTTPRTDTFDTGASDPDYANGRTGLAAFDYIFPLRYENADNEIYRSADGQNIIHEIDKYVYITANAIDYNMNPFPSPMGSVTATSPFTNQDVRYTPADPAKSTFDMLQENWGPKLPWFPLGSTVSTKDQMFDLNDVDYLVSEGEAALESYNLNKFEETIHSQLISSSNTCINCHSGQVSGAPTFSVPNIPAAYDALKRIRGADLDDPSNSVLVQKMNSFHSGSGRCGTNAKCTSLAQSFLAGITSWSAGYNAQKALAQSGSTFKKVFSRLEQTPGQMQFKFNVKEAAKFRFLARVRHTGPGIENSDRSSPPFFHYELVTSAGAKVPLSNASGTLLANSCNTSNILYSGDRDWKWVDSGTSYYNLAPGEYALKLIEGREGIEFDQVGLSQNLTLSPVAMITSTPTIINRLEFNISKLTGIADAKFVINVQDFKGFYKFTDAHVVAGEDVWVKDIQVMINGQVNPNDATLRTVAKIQKANTNDPLSTTPLLVLKQQGRLLDKVNILFQQLRKAVPNDVKVAADNTRLNGRYCRDIEDFKKNIYPIFTGLQLWPDTDYWGHYYIWLKGAIFNNRPAAFDADGLYGESLGYFRTPRINNCISCHSGSVPVFHMDMDAEKLCAEVIKRVNFSDPESSTIFRGVNTQLGHGRMMFPEVPNVDSNGIWGDNADSHNKKSTTFVTGDILQTYPSYDSLFNNGNCKSNVVPGSAEEIYLKKFIGTYKKVHAVTLKEINPNAQITELATVWYEKTFLGQATGAPTVQDKKNIMRKLYPGDYACTNIPVNQRISPEGPIGNQGALLPNKLAADYTHWYKGSNPEWIVVYPEMDTTKTLDPDLNQGREVVKDMIIKWILREKARKDAQTP